MNRKKNFIIFVVVAIGIMLVLRQFIPSMPLVMGVTYVLLIGIYLATSLYRRNKRIALLNDRCDPEAFMNITLQQEALTGKNKKNQAILQLDKAAAYLCMGEDEKALATLLSIQEQFIKNPQLKIVHTINLILAYYATGDIDSAEKIYEQEIGLLLPTNRQMKRALQILTGERYYYIGKHKECVDYFEALLKQPTVQKVMHKRQYAGINYVMALSNIELESIQKAEDQLQKVLENGHKLAIVNEARLRLSEISAVTS